MLRDWADAIDRVIAEPDVAQRRNDADVKRADRVVENITADLLL